MNPSYLISLLINLDSSDFIFILLFWILYSEIIFEFLIDKSFFITRIPFWLIFEVFSNSNFNLSIKDKNQFYKIFQTSKKLRKPIKNIFFDIEMNLFNDEIKINNININNLKTNTNEEIIKIIDNFNSNERKLNKWIHIKKLTNDVLGNYFGWIIFFGLTILL